MDMMLYTEWEDRFIIYKSLKTYLTLIIKSVKIRKKKTNMPIKNLLYAKMFQWNAYSWEFYVLLTI